MRGWAGGAAPPPWRSPASVPQHWTQSCYSSCHLHTHKKRLKKLPNSKILINRAALVNFTFICQIIIVSKIIGSNGPWNLFTVDIIENIFIRSIFLSKNESISDQLFADTSAVDQYSIVTAAHSVWRLRTDCRGRSRRMRDCRLRRRKGGKPGGTPRRGTATPRTTLYGAGEIEFKYV